MLVRARSTRVFPRQVFLKSHRKSEFSFSTEKYIATVKKIESDHTDLNGCWQKSKALCETLKWCMSRQEKFKIQILSI
jgi:hypothetical protein